MKKRKIFEIVMMACFILSGCGGDSTSGNSNENASSSENMKYVITFDLNGGTTEKLFYSPITVNRFDTGMFFYNVEKEGYNFRGWSYKGEQIVDEKGTLFKTPEMESEMTFVAIFEQNVRMYVYTNMPEAGEIGGTGIYEYNSSVDVFAHPYQGYNFVGWYYEDTLISVSQEYKYTMWNIDVILEARFKLATFFVDLSSNDADCGLVMFKNEDDKYNDYSKYASNRFKYTDEVTVVALSKTDARFLGWYDENNELVSANAVYTFKMVNHDYKLEAKWNHFKIEYNLNGGVNSEDNPSFFTLEDEIRLSDASGKAGYTFAGWYSNDEKIDVIEKGTIGNLTIEARWTADLQKLAVTSEDASEGTVEIVSGEGYTDEEITVKATPINGCIFKGWYEEAKLVSYDEAYTFTMPANDYSLTAKFWTKEENLGMTPVFDSESKTVTYGLYPQTHVSDDRLISSLNELATAESNGWYLYDGSYYAKKSANPYSSSYTFGDGTKIVKGTEYWFKCEPITWDILTSDDGTYSLVAHSLLDAHEYNEYYSGTKDGAYANNYEKSEIREWLNGTFYDSAFALDDSLIQTVTVDNSVATTNYSTNQYACDNTEDKVYLLSYQDYESADYFADDAARQCKVTDWAKANYACRDRGYWTRSPYSSYSKHALYVGFSSDGYNLYRDDVDYSYYCVRPAITIKVA